jgi:predicted DCC family thiol-disulfide oxidoreductase YuxK
VRRDHHDVLAAVPIQSPLGSELLVDALPSDRLRSAHVIRDDDCRHSGGAAVADVLSVLPPTRMLGRLGRRFPRTAALLYGVVAVRRTSFGRLVGKEARRRADELLGVQSASTAAELKVRSKSQT